MLAVTLTIPCCRHLRPERDLEDAAARQPAEEEGAQRRQHRAGQAGAWDRGEHTTHRQNMASASTRLSDIVISDNILDLTPQKVGAWPNIVLISDANMMTNE